MDLREMFNFKEEQEMSLTKAVEAKQDELVRSARVLGENLSRRAFGERGPDLNVTLVDLEQLLRPLVQAMASGFLAVSAEEQTQRLGKTLPCPTCGRACEREDHERTLTAEDGPFTWSEPACHCEHCDRSFFPSASGLED
jgi:NADH pyrophosphatase NudC (nudix superfamily)